MTSSRTRSHRAAVQALTSLTVVAVVAVVTVATNVTPAVAAPQNPQVERGNVQINRNGNETVIRAGRNAVINYDRFDVRRNETVRFVQPDRNARVLNRVTGGELSLIEGRLLANGRVYFVNPAGIYIANGAVIDTAAFYAVAGRLTTADFLAGVDRFTQLEGQFVNDGAINADEVYAVGEFITNRGSITTGDGGAVVLAAGSSVIIGEVGGRISVTVDGEDLADPAHPGVTTPPSAVSAGSGVLNVGDITSPNGRVVLGAGDMYALAIRHRGSVDAAGGHVTLNAKDGAGSVTGSITADTIDNKLPAAPGFADPTLDPRPRIAICHFTGSPTLPYVVLLVDDNGNADGHADHAMDVIPAPDAGCPPWTPPSPPPDTPETPETPDAPEAPEAPTLVFDDPADAIPTGPLPFRDRMVREALLGPEGRAQLSQLVAVDTRDLTAQELEEAIAARKFYNDLALALQSAATGDTAVTARPVALNRVQQRSAQAAMGQFQAVFVSRRVDAETGEVTLVDRTDEIRTTLAQAWPALVDGENESETDTTVAAARRYVQGLAELLSAIERIGLSELEYQAVAATVLGPVVPEGVTVSELHAVITGEPLADDVEPVAMRS